MKRIRKSFFAIDATISALLSVEPSSTIISSQLFIDCVWILSMARLTVSAELKQGITTEIAGDDC